MIIYAYDIILYLVTVYSLSGIYYNRFILPMMAFFGFLLFMIIHEILDNGPKKPRFIIKDFLLGLFNIFILATVGYWVQQFMRKDDLVNINIIEHIYTIALWYISTDIIFYYVHRLSHHKYIYKYIHKSHHKYKIARPIYCQYGDIYEVIIINIPSIFGILLIFNTQWIISVGWMMVMINHNTYSHKSTFQENYHAYHHLYYKYNYGNSQWMDDLHGTSISPKYINKKI